MRERLERDAREREMTSLRSKVAQNEGWRVGVENAAGQAAHQQRMNSLMAEWDAMINPPQPPAEPEVIYVEKDEGSDQLGDRDFNPKLAGFPAGPTAFFGERTDSTPTGVIGGLQIGYNWQSAPNWVWGIETDFQGSSQQDSICIVGCDTYLGVSSLGAPTFQTIKQNIDWFGTIRGRAGWTNGPTLFYITGGWAYAEIETKTADTFGFIVGAPQGAFNFNDTRSGWTVGGGIESHLFGNWTGKIEYLYMDFGTIQHQYSFPIPGVHLDTISSSIRNNVVRVGVNYKFGPEQGPAVQAPLLPSMYWTGAYAGLNLGYGVEASRATFAFNAPPGTLINNESLKFAVKGVVGGGQVGYNWQFSNNWVGGLETDIQGSGQQSGTSCLAICGGFFAPPQFASFTQKITWLGTTRARVGWASGPALYYATGGVAYGHIETNVNQQHLGLTGGGPASFSFGETKTGWTVGGGAEAQIVGNWTGKIEYLYVDLGSISDSYNYVTPIGTLPHTISTDVRDHIFRVGLNYQFH